MKYCRAVVVTAAVLFASLACSEEFKTSDGKVYKDATVSRIEADGIEIKTRTGIFKVYFTELPPDVQERFHWAKPEKPRQSLYARLAAAAAAAPEDPAVLAKIIAAAATIIAAVALITSHIRSRGKPTTRLQRASRARAVHHGRL